MSYARFLSELPVRHDLGMQTTINDPVSHGAELHFIEPGKPNQNAFIESFNAIVRNECLNEHWFRDLFEAEEIIESWRKDYNNQRPHGSIGDRTPAEYIRAITPQQDSVTLEVNAMRG